MILLKLLNFYASYFNIGGTCSINTFHFLQINGRNVDNKTVQEAIQVIGLSKDKVTMVVKKEDGGTVSLPAEAFRSPAPAEPAKKESESESEGEVFGFEVFVKFDCLQLSLFDF